MSVGQSEPEDNGPPPGILQIEPCALTADMRKALSETASLGRNVAPLVKIFVLLALLCTAGIAAFFILGQMMDAGGWIPASDAWWTLSLSLAGGLGLATIGLWSPVQAMRDEARRAAEHLSRGEAERVRLELPERHLVIDNDGQLVFFISVPGERAIYFEINSSAKDPRWAAYERGDLFRRCWSWLRVPGSRALWHFETSGEALPKLNLVKPGDADDYAWEDALGLAPWPKDGDTIDVGIRKLEKIGAKIARGSEEA